MVKVISTGPDQSVVKRVVCRNCGATLEYVPRDIQSRSYTDYGGDSNIDYYINCPPCGEKVYVKRY
jgi:DNA-directed RNA polymerase subunit RPC12/RpoP